MSVQKSYMEKVDLIMVCYDVSDDKAFHTIDKWIKMSNDAALETPIVLIATKTDLRDEKTINGKLRFDCAS